MDVVAGEVIVQQPGVDAVIPHFRRNVAARAVAHKGLRHGEVQALLADIEARRGIGDKFGQRHAGVGGEGVHPGHRRGVDPHARQLAAGQARA